MMRSLTMSVLVLSALALAGCNVQERIAEEVAGRAVGGDVDVDADDGSVRIETDEGSVEVGGTSGSLPNDFPEQFPVPDGLQILHSAGAKDAEGAQNFTVLAGSTQAFDEIAPWFSDQLPANGWTVDSEQDASFGDIESRTFAVTGHGYTGAVGITVAQPEEGSEQDAAGIVSQVTISLQTATD